MVLCTAVEVLRTAASESVEMTEGCWHCWGRSSFVVRLVDAWKSSVYSLSLV